MRRSVVVQALLEIISQGTFNVKPEGARRLNTVYEAGVKLLNELESEEKAVRESDLEPK